MGYGGRGTIFQTGQKWVLPASTVKSSQLLRFLIDKMKMILTGDLWGDEVDINGVHRSCLLLPTVRITINKHTDRSLRLGAATVAVILL